MTISLQALRDRRDDVEQDLSALADLGHSGG